MLLVTLLVRLKMEFLSGLTDLVVSMTKTMGGLNGMEGAGLLVGQLLHLQATQRRPGGHNESGFESAGSHWQCGGRMGLHLQPRHSSPAGQVLL